MNEISMSFNEKIKGLLKKEKLRFKMFLNVMSENFLKDFYKEWDSQCSTTLIKSLILSIILKDFQLKFR